MIDIINDSEMSRDHDLSEIGLQIQSTEGVREIRTNPKKFLHLSSKNGRLGETMNKKQSPKRSKALGERILAVGATRRLRIRD